MSIVYTPVAVLGLLAVLMTGGCDRWPRDNLWDEQCNTGPCKPADGGADRGADQAPADVAREIAAPDQAADVTPDKALPDQAADTAPKCGDKARNGNEQCDGTDLGNMTCPLLGFHGGVLKCRQGCTFDTSGCFRHTFQVIESGKFTMGSPKGEPCGASTGETPREVTLTGAFEISNTEVTNEQYERLMKLSKTATCRTCPRASATWHQAAAYCNAMSTLRGLKTCYSWNGKGYEDEKEFAKAEMYDCPGYRLPTEAEFERAYRATSKTAYYNGIKNSGTYCTDCTVKVSSALDLLAWYCANANLKGIKGPLPVGSKEPNPWLLYDMAGNVTEWTQDWFVSDLSKYTKDPLPPKGSIAQRVTRGGSWKLPASKARAAARHPLDPDLTSAADQGFRCVRSLTPGLVAHWKLDDGAGTTVKDSAGSYHGTLIASKALGVANYKMPSWEPKGLMGGALRFHADGGYVRLKSAGKLSFNPQQDSYTVSLWFKVNSFNKKWAGVLLKDHDDKEVPGYSRSYELKVGQDNGKNSARKLASSMTCMACSSTGLKESITAQAPTALGKGVWTFATVVVTPNISVDLYQDGVKSGTTTMKKLVKLWQGGNTKNLMLGFGYFVNFGYNTEAHFDGWMDDVRIYDRALSPAGVRLLYLSAPGWKPLPTTAAPSKRAQHTAVWTGKQMIIWGGSSGTSTLKSGGRFDPFTDTWKDTSQGANLPGARARHTAVWTGSEMIVWGGSSGSAVLDTGARYDPTAGTAGTWTKVKAPGPPPAREKHTAVWTGSEMIIWGGHDGKAPLKDGSRHDPVKKTWTKLPTAGAPSARKDHTAVWTGAEMIVWGGHDGTAPVADGGRYDPVKDVWTPIKTSTTISHRTDHVAVWTGKRMIVWGGEFGTLKNDGAAYDPTATSKPWTKLTSLAGPTARKEAQAVWTGERMIIWGGHDGKAPLTDGAAYDPTAKSWTKLRDTGRVLHKRYRHTMIWTGAEVLVWGGVSDSDIIASGERYRQ